MKIIKKYKIANKSDLIFTKTDLKNFFRHQNVKDKELLLLGVMEFGTNILKYAGSGEIWLLKINASYGIVALDRGGGIKNIKWAKEKGTSSSGSLGLGLYQLSKCENFVLDIFSSEKEPNGTVVFLRPKEDKNICYLIDNYVDLFYGGDFVFSKGKFLIIGDVSGHGRIAAQTVEKIKKFLLNIPFSCLTIDNVLKKLHHFLMENNLRSVVLSILEITKNNVDLCGVGNLNVFVKEGKEITYLTFKDGVIGESFSKSSRFNCNNFSQIFVTTDGISQKIMYNILNKTDDFYLSVIAGIYFGGVRDDKTILGVKNGT